MAILLVAGTVTSDAAAAIDLSTNTGVTGVNTTVPQSTLKVNVYPSTVGVGKSVKIIVSTAITNTPVSNADVYVKNAASLNWKYIGETDSNGQVAYKFSNAGLYIVKAEKSGYLPGTATVTVKPVGRLIVSARVVGYSPACTLKSFGSLQDFCYLSCRKGS